MAQKDVELRLKARDQASAVTKKVRDAYRDLSDEFERTAGVADKGGSAINALTADLAKLQSEAARIKAFGNVTAQIEKSNEALARSATAVKRAESEFAALASAQVSAKGGADSYTATIEKQSSVLESAKATLSSLTGERTKAKSELDKMTKAEERLATASDLRSSKFKTSPGVGLESVGTTGAARASMEVFVKADVAAAATKYAALNAEVEKYKGIQKSATEALSDATSKQRTASAEQKTLAKNVETAGNALLAARAAAAAQKTTLEELTATAAKASTGLSALANNEAAIAAASKATADQIARTAAARQALSRFSGGEGEIVDPKLATSLQKQNAIVAAAKVDLAAMREEVVRLKTETIAAGRATPAQTAAISQLTAASRLAEIELRKQAVALSKLRGMSGFGVWASAKIPISAAAAATTTLTAAQKKLNDELARASGAYSTLNNRVTGATSAINKSATDKRQALSITQRLRGEVLALATGYLGLQAAIGGTAKSITAYRSLEAVESRLGAVFQQDTSRVSQEVDFLRGQADRLGISFASLGEQYGKFAIAASSANFTSENTRKIFLSVAEAGRVNKLSLDQLNGTFLAIEQIISKGKFTSEEVRRQLGDRLPGAFNILADAMGVTTMELDKLMANGELFSTESNMLKFADSLSSRFGPQLSASLNTVSTDIGRFENNIFKAQLALANGFVPQLRAALQSFNEFANSEAGSQAFASMGAAIGQVIRVIALLPEHFDKLILVAKGFLAVKLGQSLASMAPVVGTLVGSFGNLSRQLTFIGPQMQVTTLAYRLFGQTLGTVIGAIDRTIVRQRALMTVTGASTVTTRAYIGVLTALRGTLLVVGNVARSVWAMLGGLPGLIATGVVLALSSWVGGVDDATKAMTEHQRQLEAIRAGYQTLSKTTDEWAARIESVNLSQAIRSNQELKAAYQEMQREFANYANIAGASASSGRFQREAKAQAESIKEVTEQFIQGSITLEDYNDALELIALDPASDAIKSVVDRMLDMLNTAKDGKLSMVEMRKALEESDAALRVMNNTATEADNILLGLTGTTDELGAAMGDTTNIDAFTSAINTLKGAIPELADEMKKLKEMSELNGAAWSGLVAAFKMGDFSKVGEIVGLWSQATVARVKADPSYEAKLAAERGTPQGADMEELVRATAELAAQMGLSAQDLLTAMSYETAGTFDPWKKGPVTQHGQHRGLIQWGEPQAEQYGVNSTTSITDQVNAAGKYLADRGVEAGDGLLQIYAAINAGHASKINASDANNGGAPGTVLDKVNDQMTGHQAKAAALLSTYGQVAATAEQVGRAESDGAKATAERTGELDHSISQQQLILQGKEREAAIEQAIKEAREADPTIKDDELQAIIDKTGQLFDMEADKTREQAAATSERIADTDFELSQQALINAGKERQAAIEEVIRAARAENPNISEAELSAIREKTGALYDQQNATTGIEAAEERVNQLYSLRQQLLEQQDLAEKNGDVGKLAELKARLSEVNTQTAEAVKQAIAMWQAVGGPEADAAIAKLETMGMSLRSNSNDFMLLGLNAAQIGSLVGSFVDGFVGALDTFAESVANGEKVFDALGTAFLSFAADFLREIGQMIVKQALLNSLSGSSGSSGIMGIIGSAATGLGGLSGGNSVASSPFTYHTGGIAGMTPDKLGHDEVSATLKRGEEILTEDNPRHRDNFGGKTSQGSSTVQPVIANFFDAPAFLESGLGSREGSQVFMNFVNGNAAQIKAALEG